MSIQPDTRRENIKKTIFDDDKRTSTSTFSTIKGGGSPYMKLLRNR